MTREQFCEAMGIIRDDWDALRNTMNNYTTGEEYDGVIRRLADHLHTSQQVFSTMVNTSVNLLLEELSPLKVFHERISSLLEE